MVMSDSHLATLFAAFRHGLGWALMTIGLVAIFRSVTGDQIVPSPSFLQSSFILLVLSPIVGWAIMTKKKRSANNG
jgi:hypothetical protein